MSTKTQVSKNLVHDYIKNDSMISNKTFIKSSSEIINNIHESIKKLDKKSYLLSSKQKNSLDDQIYYYRTGITYSMNYNGKLISMYEFGKKRNDNQVLLIQRPNSNTFDNRQIINKLVLNKFFVVTFDLPGHGFSEGKNPSQNEIESIVTKIKNRYNKKFVEIFDLFYK